MKAKSADEFRQEKLGKLYREFSKFETFHMQEKHKQNDEFIDAFYDVKGSLENSKLMYRNDITSTPTRINNSIARDAAVAKEEYLKPLDRNDFKTMDGFGNFFISHKMSPQDKVKFNKGRTEGVQHHFTYVWFAVIEDFAGTQNTAMLPAYIVTYNMYED